MSIPCVSVLMPVYEGERYLEEAIESILNQTFRDFELIVIDDGSTDGTAGIVERYRRADGRIRVFEQANHGLAATLNRGLELAQGEYVARMDADDISLPERLAVQVAFMNANRQVGICGTWVETFDSIDLKVLRLPTDDATIRSWLLFESVLPHPSIVMRREVLLKAGLSYDETCLHAEDYDLWVRASRRTALANVSEVLLRYRLHPQQVVRKYEAEKFDSAKRIRQSQLKYLGLSPAEGELELHQALSTWQFDAKPDFIDAAHGWLVKLKNANEVAGIYQPAVFSRVLGQRWTAICTMATHLGLWTGNMFWRSPLRRDAGLTWTQLLKLLLKCVIRQRQHA